MFFFLVLGSPWFLKDPAPRRVLEGAGGFPCLLGIDMGTSPRPPRCLPERVIDIYRHLAESLARDEALAGRVSLLITGLIKKCFSSKFLWRWKTIDYNRDLAPTTDTVSEYWGTGWGGTRKQPKVKLEANLLLNPDLTSSNLRTRDEARRHAESAGASANTTLRSECRWVHRCKHEYIIAMAISRARRGLH